MSRIPVVAGNWKMNKTVAEAQDLVSKMSARLNNGAKLRTRSAAGLNGSEWSSIDPPHDSSHSLLR